MSTKRGASHADGRPDPGYVPTLSALRRVDADTAVDAVADIDLAQAARDQIVARIQSRFAGHALSRLVAAILDAEGWVTKVSPPGADGGVDILGGRGTLGLDAPRLVVQVKSQPSPVDVTVYRTLQGSMQSYKADQGLLVAWGGVNKAVQAEARQSYFSVRIWDSSQLLESLLRNYEKLPAELQTELALTRVWMVVQDDSPSDESAT